MRPRTGKAPIDEVSDDDLVASALSGDERAWDAIIDRYAAYILAIVSRAFGIGGLAAEEVFQDVCVRLFDGLEGFAGRAPFRSWLRAVTLSACREYLRRSARHRDVDVEPSPDSELSDLESALDIRRAVAALGEPCRATLELHFFEDLTQAEVAKRL